MQTKEYILTNSTQLLNSQGATNTSLRQIAAYLEMSDGNLRYHFRTKEELINSLFFQMQEELILLNQQENPSREYTLQEVREQYRISFYTMYRYKFLFLEADLLSKQYKQLAKGFKKFKTARSQYLLQVIRQLQLTKQDCGSVDNSEVATHLLLEQMLILADNWIRYVDMEKAAASSMDTRIDHYITVCLFPLVPLLSEQEKNLLLK